MEVYLCIQQIHFQNTIVKERVFVYSDVVLFVFVLCLVYPMLQVSLNYLFLIAPSVFSYVYLSM